MSSVSIARCSAYEPHLVETALENALSPYGGMGAFVSPGMRVLLKVNLLAKAAPERAVTSHPEVLRAVIRSVHAAGGVVLVGDSPGGPNTASQVAAVHRESGIADVCAQEQTELVLFDDDCVRAAAPGAEFFPTFTLGRAVVEADAVISIPKFKTHGFMMFTGAVKNLFGCIPGLEKAQYHLKVPDRDDFGSMLVDLMLAVRPVLTIMDAIVGMEGHGPAGGTPKQIGALLASPDAAALDVVASSMAGFDPMEVYTNRAASRRGLGPASVEAVTCHGVDWRELAPDRFALPERDLPARVPHWLSRRARHWVTARPKLDRIEECTKCGTCQKSCPVGAISRPSGTPEFDYHLCIRCYCCQELCPPQVIGLKMPAAARLVTRRSRRSMAGPGSS